MWRGSFSSFLMYCLVSNGSYGGGVLESRTSPTSIVRAWLIYLCTNWLIANWIYEESTTSYESPWSISIVSVVCGGDLCHFCGVSHGLVGSCSGVLENTHCLSQLLGWGLFTCWEFSLLAKMMESQKSTVSYTG